MWSQLDQQIFNSLYQFPSFFFIKAFFYLFSLIGDGGFIWIILGTFYYLKKKNWGKWFEFISTLASLSILVILILKPFFQRPRPLTGYNPSLSGDEFSFPSGHAASSWAMAWFLARDWPAKRYWFYLLALLITYSRLYLGKHYPADLLAGTLLGIAWTVFLRYCFFKLHHYWKKRNPSP